MSAKLALPSVDLRPSLRDLRVLVTCDEDNLGSRRVIERCGGALEDTRDGKRRYGIAS